MSTFVNINVRHVCLVHSFLMSAIIIINSCIPVPDEVWPACQPKEEYKPGSTGILAGWMDGEPTYLYDSTTVGGYRFSNYFPRQMQVEEVVCRDPAWMNSNTYYPQGTVCYRDPSLGEGSV